MCSLEFFEVLSYKLAFMVTSLQKQFDECHEAAQPKYAEDGYVIVETEIPSQMVGVKLEYVEYIRRYGPPTNGIFDQSKLAMIRSELGI